MAFKDIEVGGQAFSAMDAAETPGTRASVDMCELKLELQGLTPHGIPGVGKDIATCKRSID